MIRKIVIVAVIIIATGVIAISYYKKYHNEKIWDQLRVSLDEAKLSIEPGPVRICPTEESDEEDFTQIELLANGKSISEYLDETISVTPVPGAGNLLNKLKWISSDQAVAKIMQSEGQGGNPTWDQKAKVLGISEGNVKISVADSSGNELASTRVKVCPSEWCVKLDDGSWCCKNCVNKCGGPDGCGGECPPVECPHPQSCGGGDHPYECGCTPITDCGDRLCGPIDDNCGGILDCGPCGEGFAENNNCTNVGGHYVRLLSCTDCSDCVEWGCENCECYDAPRCGTTPEENCYFGGDAYNRGAVEGRCIGEGEVPTLSDFGYGGEVDNDCTCL